MEEPQVEQPMDEVPAWKRQEGVLLAQQSLEEKRKEEIKQKRLVALAKARDDKRRMIKARLEKSKEEKKEEQINPTPAIKIDAGSDEPIVFFTESDIDPVTKKIKNTYPTYFNRKQKDDLEEEIRKYEKGLANNYYQPGDIGQVRENLKKAKASLEKIQEHAPMFEKHKDRIYNMTKELGEKIRESQFSRSDMIKGLADAHEEARRMSEPVIELPPNIAGMAVANGMRVHDGRRVTRDDAIRLWQFGRKSLGEMCDAEALRRD